MNKLVANTPIACQFETIYAKMISVICGTSLVNNHYKNSILLFLKLSYHVGSIIIIHKPNHYENTYENVLPVE